MSVSHVVDPSLTGLLTKATGAQHRRKSIKDPVERVGEV